jgi:hypothetical protein
VKVSSIEKKMKKQCEVFSIDEKMQILPEVDAHVGTWVDLAAVLDLSVLMLNMVVSKRSEIEKSYSRCGPLFSKERKSLKTSPLEELETILLAWFKQVRTISTSINIFDLKEGAHLGIDSFRASNSWIDRFKERHNVVYKTVLGESAIVNPETVTDWKSEEVPKITDTSQRTYLMLTKLDSSIISSPARH